MSEAAPRAVVGSFDVTVNLTDRRGIKMTGYVYSDDTPAEINARVDLYQDVLDRQAVRVDIVNKEAQIAGHTQNLEALKQGYEELVAIKESGKRLSSAQQQALTNFEPGVRRAKEMIESLRAAVKVAREKVGISPHAP